jgi:hypothetical protein
VNDLEPTGREDDAAISAYLIIHPDGPAFATLAEQDRNRWRHAFGVARKITPIFIVTDIQMDFSETSFLYAISLLGRPPTDQVTIYHTNYSFRAAYDLCQKYNCARIEMPREMLVTRFAWGVASRDGMAWSAPSD